MDDAGSVFFASIIGITVVLLAGWVGQGLVRRRSAALRSWICRLAFAGVLLVPIAVWVGTGAWDPPARLEIDIPMGPEAVGPDEFRYGEATVTLDFDDSPLTDWQERMAPALESGPPEPEGVRRESYGVAPSLSAALAQPTEPVDPKHSAVVSLAPGPLWQLATPAVLGLWAMVLGVLLLWYTIQWLRLRSLARSAGAPPTEVLGVVREIKDRLVVRRGVRVRVTDRCSVPFVFGGLSPTLMIPAEGAIPAPVIAHELAHLARYDPEINSLCRWLTAALWWHPLAWVLLRRLVSVSEEAADDWAIAQAESPEAYGKELLSIAQRAKRGSRYAVSYRGGVLKARMRRILDAGVGRARRVGYGSRLACLGFLAAALVAAAAARVNTEDPMTRPASVRVAVSEPRPDPSTAEGRDRMLREAVYNLWMSNAETSKPYGLSLVEELGEDGLPAYFAVEVATRPSPFDTGELDELEICGGTVITFESGPRWDPDRAQRLMEGLETHIQRRWGMEPASGQRVDWSSYSGLTEAAVAVPARWLNDEDLTVQAYAASRVCYDHDALMEA
ncbi:MAG: hypothetical protein GF320_11990, partial [Armatimonadia bacterium]|nr:hypothetical protein [Armatimonadia bacterium]